MERVPVLVGERHVPAMHQQLGIGRVAPGPVRMKGDRDPVVVGAERPLQKGCRADAVVGLPAGCGDDDLVGIRARLARRDGNLPARDSDGLHDEAGGRLPEPVADLIVKRDVLFLGRDVDVVAQAVKQLRPVRLRVDRLKIDGLDEHAPLRAFRLGVEVHTLACAPAPRQSPQGTQIIERFRIDVAGFREDIREGGYRRRRHGGTLIAVRATNRHRQCLSAGAAAATMLR